MNEKDTLWDYSQVPSRVWKWYLSPDGDHWMEVHIKPSGLTYIGTDWTVQSGGGYFGGFQTFDEFLRDGPIQKMPNHIAAELREHLEAHRVPGGATLRVLHLTRVDDLVLQGAYIHLDDNPITVSIDETLAQKREVVFFDGSIGIGDHQLSFVLVFKSKQQGSDALWKVHGEFSFAITPGTKTLLLETIRDEDGSIRVHYLQ
ncbi:MAG: hypothetical protein ACFFCO_07520 [Promethearchaeota archaeon]